METSQFVRKIRNHLADRLDSASSWTANQAMVQFEFSVLDALDDEEMGVVYAPVSQVSSRD